MRKVLFLGACALGVAACTPDIAQDPPPTNAIVVAEFDPAASPAIVPTPNDLAINRTTGLVNAPINPQAPAAEQEFTRDYLNTLDGFPAAVSASTQVKNLNPDTVNTDTVKVLDLYEGSPLARPPNYVVAYNKDTQRINVLAPNGWPKGGRYAVVLVGGENGLKTVEGEPVVASATWAFASSQVPLVTCEDLTDRNCRAATELIPATATDPAERIAQQTATALQLEQLRRNYGPVIDAAASKWNLKRDDIVLLWTFTVMNQPEMSFNPDPVAPVIPFPNDLLRNPATATAPATLRLPTPPATASDLEKNLIRGLNSLDGWSTTAPIVSENGANLGPIDNGSLLDPNTVVMGATVQFVKLTNRDKGTTPKVRVCLDCASSKRPDGTASTGPQQLQLVPEVPLDEATQYAAVMLSRIRNAEGKVALAMKDQKGRVVAPATAMAILRLANPIFVDGRSQLSVLPDSLAQQLEPIRAGMKPLFDALEANGIKRQDVSLAWAFTTQSTRAVLEKLNAAPSDPRLAVPADPQYLTDQTTNLKATMQALGFDNAAVGRAFVGGFLSPYMLSDVEGVLNRPLPETRVDRLPFMLFLPNTPAPQGGYPVVVFGHGLTGNRSNVLVVANTLNASGFAVAAIDSVYHGDRTSCAGISPQAPILYGDPANPTVIDDPDEACAAGTCDVTPGSATFGRCVTTTAIACNPAPTSTDPTAVHGDLVCQSQGQGRCVNATGKCEGGRFLSEAGASAPVVSGWNFLNLTNLFATRDNFRHSVVDFAQLARVLGSDGINSRLAAAGAGTLNGTRVDYVGQSLGGLQGTLAASVSPRMRHVALNAAGGGLVDVLLTATNPVFVARRNGFLAALAPLGRTPGTPQFDEFIGLARTILDPADPVNYGYYLENAPSAPAERQAFIQYIKGDNVIPNPVTDKLVAAANQNPQRSVASYMFDVPPLPADVKHGFLAIFDPGADAQTAAFLKSVRDAAQGQVAGFLQSGAPAIP
ncbi:hypothetical protein [Pyxidicoccus xibeiensis]|uniref:hypothetical protein n=1 Tax=Pyxidicoccus xibeiensis TaxID=2906759 RepID=UPI0020A7A410|nr:hypothetical protein [Pyxidicoccus xibeiensis]MCP3140018.1 hypothetical protein [Pyxidicoccus xibeiensis]